jgi:drug/metabolite transporter (DMT)-like permease
MNVVPQIVYLLCAVTSCACTVLLLRGHRRTRVSLLFWSGVAFLAFTVSNLLLVVDLAIMGPDYDLSLWRGLHNLAGVVLLLYGLIRTRAEL